MRQEPWEPQFLVGDLQFSSERHRRPKQHPIASQTQCSPQPHEQMGLPDSARTNEEHVVVAGQKCPLRQFQEAHLGNARDQRKVKVLQALLIREGGGFETLAHLLLLSMSQLAFKQRLQVAQIPQSSLFRFTGSWLTIALRVSSVMAAPPANDCRR